MISARRILLMKIGICAPIVEPNPTGVGFYSINLVNEMVRLSDNLLLYTSHPCAFDIDRAKICRVSWLTKPQHGLMGFLSRMIWMQISLPLRTLVDRTSVILSISSEGTLFPLVPQVVTVHDITPLVFPPLHPHRSELFFFKYFLPLVLSHSAAVIAVSKSTKEDLIKVYHLPAEKIHVIYEGYDTMLFHHREDTRDVIRSYGLKDYIHYAGNILPTRTL
jgi:glycosyltransferase involved in cell wall biosynthesis